MGALESKFPHIKAVSRLNYLRLVHPNGLNREVRQFHWTNSFIERFELVKLRSYASTEAALLVVGPLWSQGFNVGPHGKPQALLPELKQQLSNLLVRLSSASKVPLTHQQRESLATQVLACWEFNRGSLDSNIESVVLTLEDATGVLVSQTDISRRLSSAQWACAVQWIAFWRSRRFFPLLEYQIARPILAKLEDNLQESDITFSLMASLTGSRKPQDHSIRLTVNMPIAELKANEFRFRLELAGSPSDSGTFTFECPYLNTELEEDHFKTIQLNYLQFLEERKTTRSRQDYLAFDRLRVALQDLPFEDSDSRSKIIVLRARRLITADYAALFSYNSLTDSLHFEDHRASSWASEPNGQHLQQLILSAAKDHCQRAASVVYRCLDNNCIQATTSESPLDQPEDGAEVSRNQLPADISVWGFPAADFLAVPITSFGRVLGVLYLATAEAQRFHYADQNRLTAFVHSLEAEVFEARLLRSLQRINHALGRALRKVPTRHDQQVLVEEMLREVGSLLALRGVSLWWLSSRDKGSMQLLGLVGSYMSTEIWAGRKLSFSEQLFARLRSDASPLSISAVELSDFLTLTSIKLPFLVLVPLRDQYTDDLMGFLMIHDSQPVEISPFTDKLLLLSQQIGKNIVEYMGSRDRDYANRELIAHEVGTALRSIDSARVRLEKFFNSRLRAGDAPALRILGDISVHIDTTRILLDYLTSEPLPADDHPDYNDSIVNFYHYLNLQPQEKPVLIRPIINETFQPRIVDLRQRRISVSQASSILPPLWVRPWAVRQVFSNIVDNIVKYGSAGQQVVLNDGCDGVEYFLSIETRGVPLREDLADAPELVACPR